MSILKRAKGDNALLALNICILTKKYDTDSSQIPV